MANYTEHLKQFEGKIDKLETAVEKIQAQLQTIITALVGNDYGDSGLVKRMELLELENQQLREQNERVKTEFKEFKSKLIGISIGFGAGASLIVSLLVKYVL
nr:hypothetical protein 27 [bacterium]